MCERGMIFWCDLTPYAKKGSSIQSGVRPVIVIANNRACQYSPVIFVSPITSRLNKNRLPVHVEIGEESGINKPSIILLEQIITIDKKDLGDYIGHIPFDKMVEVDMAFAISGGIKVNKDNNEIFDIKRANEMLKTLKDTESMLQLMDNEYFRTVKGLIVSELKSYCDRCGVNYNSLIKKDQKQYLRGIGDVVSV